MSYIYTQFLILQWIMRKSTVRTYATGRKKRSPSSPSRLAYRNKQAQLLRAIEGLGNRIDGLQERLHRAFEHELPGARWGT
jgi:hypothetical protein